ncbi:MAG TPA: tetratricopeptide repeat protein [Bryobacteraceae bacterium]|jgi:tetratricopeptide (TPR) repeat protein|nr:tetratricopeptide repeat protein [Bryobacteraceae bacterium]
MRTRRRKAIETPEMPADKRQLTVTRVVAACAIALFVYGPALTGPFVFDDTAQFYGRPAEEQPFIAWIGGLRPLLNFSFWLNHLLFGGKPLCYHVVNVVIHLLNTLLVFLVTRKLLGLYRKSTAPQKLNLLAGFAAALFLLHPIQTESVAYIAGRSETLCAFFMLAALTLFVYHLPGPLTWRPAIGIVLLCAAACATKEQAVALAPLLLLTDLFWNSDLRLAGLRKNWRLYLPLAAAGLLAGAWVLRILAESPTAGFGLRELTWLQYFFTECRVFFSYLRLFFLPIGQTVSPDVPLSKSILDHGTIFGLIGIIALLAAAVYFRRRYRIASFGIFLFIILLIPTSSFVPLLDPQAEHRLYLPTLALCLVVVEVMLNVPMRQGQLAAVCVAISCVCGAMTFSRNHVWADETLLWNDALSKAPNAERPYLGLSIAYLNQGRCPEAESVLTQLNARFERDAQALTLWGRAGECLGKFDEAVDRITQAAAVTPRASLYIRIGIIRNRQRKTQEAINAFNRAIELDPISKQAYFLRGQLYEAAARYDAAISDFQRALQLPPEDRAVREHLDRLQQRLRLSGSAPAQGFSRSSN